jgi:hypothetical protein
MKIKREPLFYIQSILYVCLLIGGCAQQITPSGGPEDSGSPRIIKTSPANGTLNFEGKQIVFTFSEYVKSSNLTKDVFISPLQEPQPEMFFKGRKLFIQWEDQLPTNSTIIIQPGTGIQDVSASNPLDSIFQYAISTTNYLDSGEITGKVINPLTGNGAPNITLLLFKADSISGDSILNKRPEYVAFSDDEGFFSLSCLARNQYKLYGVKDEENNYQYNSLKEAIALTNNPLINLMDSNHVKRTFYLSLPDNKAPRIIKKSWVHQRLLEIEFSEPILDQDLDKSFLFSDTNEVVTLNPLGIWAVPDKPDKVWVGFTDSVIIPIKIKLTGISDTLNNQQDTMLIISPKQQRIKYSIRINPWKKPQSFQDSFVFYLNQPLKTPLISNTISIRDTGNQPVKGEFKYDDKNLSLIFSPDTDLISGITYNLVGDSLNLKSVWGYSPDTTLSIPFQFSSSDLFGSIDGQAIDTLSGDQDSILKISVFKFSDETQPVYIKGTSFNFPLILPGAFRIQVFKDYDNNGHWTPGSLFPYRLPEPISKPVELPKLRAGWIIEKTIVKISFPDY